MRLYEALYLGGEAWHTAYDRVSCIRFGMILPSRSRKTPLHGLGRCSTAFASYRECIAFGAWRGVDFDLGRGVRRQASKQAYIAVFTHILYILDFVRM